MTCVRIFGRVFWAAAAVRASGVAASAGDERGSDAGAGVPPASLVGIQWSVSGSIAASTSVNCESKCVDESNCTTGPDGTSLHFSGASMSQTFHQTQLLKQCYGVCGGAAMTTAFGSFVGSVSIDDPVSTPNIVVWAFRYSVGPQVGAGTSPVCGFGNASGTAGGATAWDFEFDTAPGLTLLTLVRQHVARVGSQSVWTITRVGGGGGTVFAESLPVGDIDTGFGVVERVLTQGRYRVRIDASSSRSASASGIGSLSDSSAAYLECSFTFAPYVCAGVSSHPLDRTVCANGQTTFGMVPSGNNAAVRWQWEPASSPGQWFDMTEGVNTDAGSVARFVATGAESASLTIARHAAVGGALEVIGGVRCVSSNLCGGAPSNKATLTVCRADLNCDGAANTADLTFFLSRFGTASSDGGGADINHDGQVNTADLTQFLSGFGQSCG